MAVSPERAVSGLLEAEMSDGNTVVYQIKTIMPAPRFETAERVTVGYERRSER